MHSTYSRLLIPVLLFLNSLSSVYAQDANNDTGVTGTTGTGTDSSLLDWWWVVPLVGLALFLLMRDRASEDDSRFEDQRMTGAKGGKTMQRQDREDETRS